MPKQPKLFTPGPVEVWDEVLDALGQPVINPFFRL